jgi:hypothetical protein
LHLIKLISISLTKIALKILLTFQHLYNDLPNKMNLHQPFKNILIGFYLLIICITKLNAQTPVNYTFTGNGNWNNAANWSNDTIPSAIVPGRDTITIATPTGDSCVLNQPLVVLPGAIFTVQTGTNFILKGNAPMPTIYPANILDLTNWKENLPIDANGTQTGTSEEIDQPQLATYSIYPYFRDDTDYTGVIFNANCGGATTSGSGYPRSELREMTNNGSALASWSSSVGTSTMEIDQVVTHLPVVKPQIVVGQIHGPSDDIITFRLEGTHLYMDHNGVAGNNLDSNYVLGTRFKAKFVVANNQVQSYYNGVLKETYPISFTGAYFKAGAYVQSSCKGSKEVTGESCDAYGEVIIYNVTVTHQ